MISTDQVKELRDKTGISIMQCRKALEDAGGDIEKAMVILKKKGAEIAGKKSDRTLGAGVVQSYIHSTGAVGAMVELWCETDFVAKNEEFKTLAKDIAMHIAATSPLYLSTDQIPEDAKEKAKEVFQKEVEGKPENMKETILQGKLDSYFKDMVLLEQPFVKNPDQTIADYTKEHIAKLGENIVIRRFNRIALGEVE